MIETRVPRYSKGINPPKLMECKSGASEMEETIVVVNANEAACLELCTGLQKEHFRTTALHSLLALEGEFQKTVCRVVILDLDNLPVVKPSVPSRTGRGHEPPHLFLSK